ncbi:hypothetical protein [Wukongibacter baidiensis]
MLSISDLTENTEESDDRYKCYNLNKNIKVFNCFIKGEDLQDVNIFVSCDIDVGLVFNEIISYISWLSECESDLRIFYEKELQEKVYDDWFNEIEVYRASITFNNKNDYGASITCGDKLFIDHAMEIDFEKETVENIRLTG